MTQGEVIGSEMGQEVTQSKNKSNDNAQPLDRSGNVKSDKIRTDKFTCLYYQHGQGNFLIKSASVQHVCNILSTSMQSDENISDSKIDTK